MTIYDDTLISKISECPLYFILEKKKDNCVRFGYNYKTIKL